MLGGNPLAEPGCLDVEGGTPEVRPVSGSFEKHGRQNLRFAFFFGRINSTLEQETNGLRMKAGEQVCWEGHVFQGRRMMGADNVGELMEDDVETMEWTGFLLVEDVVRGCRGCPEKLRTD